MIALILAAGVGRRLRETHDAPKCLLDIDGRSLLERQLEALFACGIDSVQICTGYQHEKIADALSGIAGNENVETVFNPRFENGSVISLWSLREALCSGQSTLVLDADVLFDPRILERLINSEHQNCFALDQDFEAGEEPVKILVRDGTMVEFRKHIDPGMKFDIVGESVGFFRFDESMSMKLAQRCEYYEHSGLLDTPHEEAIRDLLLEQPRAFGWEDITGLAWTEIDFQSDVARARNEIAARIA